MKLEWEGEKMKSNILMLSIVISSFCYAGGDLVQPVEPKIVISTQVEQFNDAFFVYVAGGAALLNVKDTPSELTPYTDGALDDQGIIGEIGLGYQYKPNFFMELAAQRTMLEIADIYNYYISMNYQLYNGDFKPYVGAILGYGQFEWSETPSEAYINEDLNADGFIYGVQVGFKQKLSENLSLIAKYQFIKYEYVLNIRSNTSRIEHNYTQHLLAGVQYAF